MPKRRSESKEEKWRRKLRKYEDKLSTKRRYKRIIYSSASDDDVEVIEESTEVQEPREEQQATAAPEADALLEASLLSAPVIETSRAPEDLELMIDKDLLQTLGEFEPEVVEWGDDLLEEVAKRFQHVLLNGLKKESREALHKSYPFPNNIKLAKAPLLNPELSTILSDTYKNRDKTILTKQDQLGKALSALGRAMSALILKSPNLLDIMRQLNDCSQLIADSHYNETYTRRSLVIPLVDKSLTDSLKNRKRDELLFGNDLSEMVKNSRGIKKTGNFMQVSAAPTSLNWKGPLTRSLPTRNYQTNRPSGLRQQQFVRGRRHPSQYPTAQRRAGQPPQQTAALAPPPPGRRQPALPSTSRRSLAPTGRDRAMHL